MNLFIYYTITPSNMIINPGTQNHFQFKKK